MPMRQIIVALMLFILPVCGFAADEKSVCLFKGTVADVNNNKPITDVAVVISCEDENVSKKVQTDEKGHFAFKDLPAGKYEISLEGKGYETYKRSAVVKEGGQLNLGFLLDRE